MDNQVQCPNYSACQLYMQKNDEEKEVMKNDIVKLKDEISNMKVQQGKDSERIITLFHTIDEIRDCMKTFSSEMKEMTLKMDKGFKEINEKIDLQNEKTNDKIQALKDGQAEELEKLKDNQTEKIEKLKDKNEEEFEKIKTKPDLFKEWLISLSKDVLKIAIAGGIIVGFLYKFGIFQKLIK